MSQFKIINLVNSTLSFAAGSTLSPGQSRPVDVITLELKRLEQEGYLKIEKLQADPTKPADIQSDYAPDVAQSGGLTFEQLERFELMYANMKLVGLVMPAVADFQIDKLDLDATISNVVPAEALSTGTDTYVAIDWGDGTPEGSSLMGPWNHTYAAAGTYQVVVRYTSGFAGPGGPFGQSVSKTIQVS